MHRRNFNLGNRWKVPSVLASPQALALWPAATLALVWFGGQPVLLIILVILPLLLAPPKFFEQNKNNSRKTDGFENAVEDALSQAARRFRKTACMIAEIDSFEQLRDRFGLSDTEDIQVKLATRLVLAIRDCDQVYPLAPGQFGFVIDPVRQFDADIALQMAKRVQDALQEPISVGSATAHVSVSIGVCLEGSIRSRTSLELIDATFAALMDARRNAPSAIRMYSPGLLHATADETDGEEEVLHALKMGQICAWF